MAASTSSVLIHLQNHAKKRQGNQKQGILIDKRSQKARKDIEDHANYINVGRTTCACPCQHDRRGSYPTCNLSQELVLEGKVQVDRVPYQGFGFFNKVFRVTEEGQ
jgi:hypothetical protein